MKKLFIGIAAIAVTTMLSGCGMTMFNAMNMAGSQVRVELAENNFKVIKDVSGHSSATYILFIGGMSRKTVRENAIADMFKSANLTGSQTITNIYVKQHVTTILGIYINVSFSASGQVIEFIPKSSNAIADTAPLYSSQSISATPKKEITHYIGETYDDGVKQGIVFTLSEDGQHGKIVCPKIFRNIVWCNKKNTGKIGTDDEIDGENNLKTVMKIKDWETKYPAFAQCTELGKGWYLPAIDELRELKNNIEFFNNPTLLLWSSTESSGQIAKALNMASYPWKTSALNVVAVAKF